MTTHFALEEKAKVFEALGDPSRLKIVELVAERTEMSGTQLAEGLGISLALLCHHTKILTAAGVVHRRKQGQVVYYTLAHETLAECFQIGSGADSTLPANS